MFGLVEGKKLKARAEMKHLLLTTIAAVVLVVTGLAGPIHDAALDGDIDEVQRQLDACLLYTSDAADE